ncbi:uncharacterized protein SPSK_06779 [Sporothrix schenckii 1099-18]|uniref:Uncharacterized protein n=1 Tax=Sporothrix schenckii 1099-18 TaxID=1397361 RepID=A0A0F2MK48_SPOSC|nr:uncharacterized protein SPSK_06779 [Sporothrix schenckii 1099-18]KJR89434.1 hypothetical protein SPSK_06779 [Sporothrix schenckii 1099-18]
MPIVNSSDRLIASLADEPAGQGMQDKEKKQFGDKSEAAPPGRHASLQHPRESTPGRKCVCFGARAVLPLHSKHFNVNKLQRPAKTRGTTTRPIVN